MIFCRQRHRKLTRDAYQYRGRYYWTRLECMRVHGRAKKYAALYGIAP